jgi:hypothetical protein
MDLFFQWLVHTIYETYSTLLIVFCIRFFLTPYDCKDLNCLYYQRFRDSHTGEMPTFIMALVGWIPLFGVAGLLRVIPPYHYCFIIIPAIVLHLALWATCEKRYRNYLRLRSLRYIEYKYGANVDSLYEVIEDEGLLCFPINKLEEALQLDAEQKKATRITDTDILKRAAKHFDELIEKHNTLCTLNGFFRSMKELDCARNANGRIVLTDGGDARYCVSLKSQ